jgi:hypothetical protein
MMPDIERNEQFRVEELFDFVDKTVLQEDHPYSVRDFSSGYFLAKIQRTGLDAILITLCFEGGVTEIVRKRVNDGKKIFVRKSINRSGLIHHLEKEVEFNSLDDIYKNELNTRLMDLDEYLMNIELVW